MEQFLLALLVVAASGIWMKRHLSDSFSLRGDVTLTLFGRDGSAEVIEYRNLIVTQGKKTLCRHIGGDGAYASEAITKIGFGTGSTAAAVGDTGLQAQILTKNVTVTYPADNQVKFTATMLENEGGSNVFRELGLLTAGNLLFSRVIISAITKSALYKIQVDWLISAQ